MTKHILIDVPAVPIGDSDIDRYPGWIVVLIWLSVMAFGALFWTAVFLAL